MKIVIQLHSQIHEALCEIDVYTTNAINKGRTVTVEYCDDAVSKKQLSSMHLWCRWCELYLNQVDAHRVSDITGKLVPWGEGDFKQCVYKPFLKAWKGKKSTKDQNTKDPEEIRMALSGHMASTYKKDICLPEWPSGR